LVSNHYRGNLDLEAVRVKFGAGLTGEYAFGNNYALTFGLEYKGAGGALAFQNAYYSLERRWSMLPFPIERPATTAMTT
jgi:hypothetical protein